MLDRQLDELKLTGHLPSPTGVGLSILRLTQGEDYAMADITRVIQSDPALTGRILKLANGSAGSGISSVTTVSEASMRLGVRTVRNLALGFTLVNGHRTGRCRAFDYESYWAQSLGLGVSAQALAAELRLALPADAFTCGLLSGIGRLALASIHPDRYERVLMKLRKGEDQALVDLERDEFDLDHRELTSAMMRDWRLPEAFAHAAEYYEAGIGKEARDDASDNMTRLLVFADRFLRTALVGGASGGGGADELDALRAELQLERSEFDGLGKVAADSWAEWGSMLHIPIEIQLDAEEVAAAADERRSSGGDEPEREPRRGLRILAVDDDALSLRLLEHHLKLDGHSVVMAGDGEQALDIALHGSPQMVITDWQMPGMDGIELCKALRRNPEGRELYLLVLTGREDEDRVVEAFDAGVDEYVVKPFNSKILLARVRAGQRMIELREQSEHDRRAREAQVAELAVLNRKLKAAAMTDVLTRLANRRYAMRRLDQEVSSAVRARRPLSLIMIDIDHFKDVNDAHGHDVGDHVLRETAGVFKRETRKSDVICRLGGEEFLVICANSTLETGHATAERIRAAVEENVIGHGVDANITVSCGVASLEDESPSVDELLKLADRRVYLAKAQGRNRVCSNDGPAGASDRRAAAG